MKHFHPYRYPPLVGKSAPAGSPAVDDKAAWQAAVERGFEQGRLDGRSSGFLAGRDAGFAAGHAGGLALGRTEGSATAQQGFDLLAGPLDAMLAGLQQLRSDYQATQRTEVVALVGRVARQVIRAELALRPVQLLALVEEALAGMPPAPDAIVVYLNPDELQRIAGLDASCAGRWNLVADARLEAGECRIRAGDNEVDAGCRQRLDGCLKKLSARLDTPPYQGPAPDGAAGAAP